MHGFFLLLFFFIMASVIRSGGEKKSCSVKHIKKSNREKNPLGLFVQPVMPL